MRTIWQWAALAALAVARGVILDLVEAWKAKPESWISHTGLSPYSATDRAADDGRLRERAVDDAGAAETPVQVLRHAEDAAVHAHVLADDDDVRVLLHLLEQGQVQGFDHVELRHRAPSALHAVGVAWLDTNQAVQRVVLR
jgi:hypothetical protein